MELKGRLIEKNPTVVNGKNGPMDKMLFVIQIPGSKVRNVAMESINKELIQIVNDTSINTEVCVECAIESRDWTGSDGVKKWFTSVSAWKISLDKDVSSPSKPVEHATQASIDSKVTASLNEDPNDLPF